MFAKYADAQAIIHADLTRQNKRLVDISRRAFYLFNSGPTKYQVKYLTPENGLYIVNCVIWLDSELFWGEPEFVRQVLPNQAGRLILRRNGYGSVPNEFVAIGKEALVNGLSSDYQQERLWTIRQVKRLRKVDDLVLHILQNMATDDPDIAVRKEAQQAIRYLA